MPLRLTDDQLEVVMRVAARLPIKLRPAYLHAVAATLYGDESDEMLLHVCIARAKQVVRDNWKAKAIGPRNTIYFGRKLTCSLTLVELAACIGSPKGTRLSRRSPQSAIPGRPYSLPKPVHAGLGAPLLHGTPWNSMELSAIVGNDAPWRRTNVVGFSLKGV